MSKLLNVYRLLNILSIDVALGAVCCSAWFAKVFEVQLRPYALLALGLTVWSIYTADHLMDASKVKHSASTKRHRFHQLNFYTLAVCLVIAVVIDCVLLFFIRTKIIYAGFILSLIVALYLLINRWLGFVKEFIIAIVYCGGILLPTLSIKGFALLLPEALLIISFLITALLNLLVFSVYDAYADNLDGHNSFALKVGSGVTRKVIVALFSVQVFVVLFMFAGSEVAYGWVLLTMNSVLFLLFILPAFFGKNEIFRLAGDAVFLFPVVFLVIG